MDRIFVLTASEIEKRLRTENFAPALMRIRAEYKAYGAEYPFLTFYGNTEDSLLISLKYGLAAVHLDKKELASEVAEFLPTVAENVLSDIALPLEEKGFVKDSGVVFRMENPTACELLGVTSELKAGYELLKVVFPDSVNEESYLQWYVDLSHRKRHGVSEIYTIPASCSCTVSTNENGTVMLAHLGTSPDLRGKGYASKILSHIASTEQVREFVLLSQNEDSNKFYEKYGFSQSGKWYIYERAMLKA